MSRPPVSIMGNNDSKKVCAGCGKRIKQSERFCTVDGVVFHQEHFVEKV